MTTPRRIVIVFGTRPEVIKLAGLVDLLGESAVLVHTGQHWDDSMSGVFLRDLGFGRPHHELTIGGMSRGEQIGEATSGLARLIDRLQPDAVVVQGDTNSALSGALAANSCEVPLVHVEAGLRSFDRAMPEEHNRVLIDHLADLCCAPTETSAANLATEGIPSHRIVTTGNTVVEAVHRLVPTPKERTRLLCEYGVTPGGYVLATIHRPENTDRAALAGILATLVDLPVPVLFPVHPRTAQAVERDHLGPLLNRLPAMAPLPYETFLGLLAECGVCVSDSGGVQEEASVLGRPVVVVRRSTERPEVQGIWATLAEAGPGLGGVVRDLLQNLPSVHARLERLSSPYGDGSASQRIAEALSELVNSP